MDFRVDQSNGVHFTYVLPFSETEALVEDTFFSEEPARPSVYEENLAAYLDSRGVTTYEITHRESGVIPMSTRVFDRRPSPRRLSPRIGRWPGATGHRICLRRDSAIFETPQDRASSTGRSRTPLGTPGPYRAIGPSISLVPPAKTGPCPPISSRFCFRDNPPERVARFLSDRSSLTGRRANHAVAPWSKPRSRSSPNLRSVEAAPCFHGNRS